MTCLTTGTFDGIHIGHQKIIETLIKKAASTQTQSLVLTFEPHPRIALYPDDENIKLLSNIEQKIEIFKSLGVNHLVIHPFNKEFSRTTVTHYIRDLLIKKLNMRHLIVGHDHHFGKNREGSIENIQELEGLYGFESHKVEALQINEINISSTKIRNALLNGEVRLAKEYLTRPYSLSGKVMHGSKVGRTIDFPTANIEVKNPYMMIPKEGVYAVKCNINDAIFSGMLNIGGSKTLNKPSKQLEIHLFDFYEDLYGKNLEIQFIEFIRENKNLGDLKGIQAQLQKDKIRALNLLN